MASATNQARRPQTTACDRCYKVKERCTRLSTADICARCDRLGYPCTTVRPPRQAGRRVKKPSNSLDYLDSSSSTSTSTTSSPTLDIGHWIDNLTNLTKSEKEKLRFLLEQPQNLKWHVVSPVFQDAERRSLAAPLPAALPVLKDAYVACAGALRKSMQVQKQASRRQQHDTVDADVDEDDDQDANLLRASAAMKTLRALPVSTPQDAALCLTLGISLALFVYSAVGHGVYEISQHCLSVARPFLETDSLDEDTESWLMLLTLMEVVECLLYRRRPTVRFPWRRQPSFGRSTTANSTIARRRRDVVDRHLGLCASLLPYYHDLCVVSHSLVNCADSNYMALVLKQLDQVQAELKVWQPSPPDQFTEQFSGTEVIHLLAQARLYRLAALLVGHRLRYVFGEQDQQAGIWADEIMNELELVHNVTKRSAHCVTMPFVVAAIEMQEPTARRQALRNVDVYVDRYTPLVQKATKAFLSRIWWERDYELTASWFDSTHKPCVVLSAVDAALFGG